MVSKRDKEAKQQFGHICCTTEKSEAPCNEIPDILVNGAFTQSKIY
jgi:hypothetical protein